jgi:hypothetical protein
MSISGACRRAVRVGDFTVDARCVGTVAVNRALGKVLMVDNRRPEEEQWWEVSPRADETLEACRDRIVAALGWEVTDV